MFRQQLDQTRKELLGDYYDKCSVDGLTEEELHHIVQRVKDTLHMDCNTLIQKCSLKCRFSIAKSKNNKDIYNYIEASNLLAIDKIMRHIVTHLEPMSIFQTNSGLKKEQITTLQDRIKQSENKDLVSRLEDSLQILKLMTKKEFDMAGNQKIKWFNALYDVFREDKNFYKDFLLSFMVMFDMSKEEERNKMSQLVAIMHDTLALIDVEQKEPVFINDHLTLALNVVVTIDEIPFLMNKNK